MVIGEFRILRVFMANAQVQIKNVYGVPVDMEAYLNDKDCDLESLFKSRKPDQRLAVLQEGIQALEDSIAQNKPGNELGLDLVAKFKSRMSPDRIFSAPPWLFPVMSALAFHIAYLMQNPRNEKNLQELQKVVDECERCSRWGGDRDPGVRFTFQDILPAADKIITATLFDDYKDGITQLKNAAQANPNNFFAIDQKSYNDFENALEEVKVQAEQSKLFSPYQLPLLSGVSHAAADAIKDPFKIGDYFTKINKVQQQAEQNKLEDLNFKKVLLTAAKIAIIVVSVLAIIGGFAATVLTHNPGIASATVAGVFVVGIAAYAFAEKALKKVCKQIEKKKAYEKIYQTANNFSTSSFFKQPPVVIPTPNKSVNTKTVAPISPRRSSTIE